MDNISRFGVFLPTYIWDDDGPERARNLVAFARRVEELGFDSLWVTDHLLVGAALLLRRLPGAAGDARRRRRRHRAGAARHVGARAPDPPARGARQGARDAAVPVGQPLHPRRRRRLEPGRVPRHGRRQDPARPADRRDPRHRDPAHGGGDGHLPRQVLPGRRGVDQPLPTRRPELWIGGGSQLANEKSPDLPTLVPAVKERILKAEGWIPRPTCPPEQQAQRLGGDPGRDARARPRPGRVHRRARELHALRGHERPATRRAASSTRRS